MNLVHTFWSKPAQNEDTDFTNSRYNGGWPSRRLLFLSIAFSCLCARRFHKKINLTTDSAGIRILCDEMMLPYNDANTLLDNLIGIDPRLWAYGKIESFRIQKNPFIHIDNDVFLWNELPVSEAKNYLIAQSHVKLSTLYKDTLADIFSKFCYIPPAIKHFNIPDSFSVANAGIIGGNDLDFFASYCDQASNFYKLNLKQSTEINIGCFNTILDEYLFTCLAKKQNKVINYLFADSLDTSFSKIMRFHMIPFYDKYIHLVGYAKSNKYACEQMQLRFEFEFPKQYKSICKVLNNYAVCESDVLDPGRTETLKNILAFLSHAKLDQIMTKKVRLIEPYTIKTIESVNEAARPKKYLVTHMNEEISLTGMNEVLNCFIYPVSMKELLDEMMSDSSQFPEYQSKQREISLLDFVMHKIVIENILEFVNLQDRI